MRFANKITLIYPYYDNPVTLAYHAAHWIALSRKVLDEVRIRVVDDGSPASPASDVLAVAREITELYRIKVDIPWNWMGARNLGAHVANPDDWLLFVDMDIFVPESVLCYLLGAKLDHRVHYTFRRIHADGRPVRPGFNIFMTTARNFWRVGGYDEDFAGTYGGDEYFFQALKRFAPAVLLDQTLVALNLLIHDSTTHTLGRQGSKYREEYFHRVAVKRSRGPEAFIPENPLRFEWERVW